MTHASSPPPGALAGKETAAADYYPWLDWLRFALALVVMLAHDDLIPWRYSGAFAVEVFFALSGWLIGGILLTTAREQLPRFYFNRAIRIWVPYYVALALLLVLGLLRDPITAKWLEIAFYQLSFVHNLFGIQQLAQFKLEMPLQGTGNHLWSVNAEEQFYLLTPLLLVLAPKGVGRSLATWVLLSVATWAFIGQYYTSIVFGVTAAILGHRYGDFQRHRGVFAALIAVGVAAAVVMAVSEHYVPAAPFAALAVVLLMAVRGGQQALGKVLGGMSYPLYLNHWIGVFLGNALVTPFAARDSVARHVISAVFALGLALAHYWFIDRQLLQRRRGWFSEARGRLVIVTAYAMVLIGLVGAGIFATR